MWKWVLVFALTLVGCATAQTGTPGAEPAEPASELQLAVDVSVWQADARATQEFYDSLGLGTVLTPGDEPVLEILAGAARLRIRFVYRHSPITELRNEVRQTYEDPEYPHFTATWTVQVSRDRYEKLRNAPGARVVVADKRESIAIRDPAGLGLQVLPK